MWWVILSPRGKGMRSCYRNGGRGQVTITRLDSVILLDSHFLVFFSHNFLFRNMKCDLKRMIFLSDDGTIGCYGW